METQLRATPLFVEKRIHFRQEKNRQLNDKQRLAFNKNENLYKIRSETKIKQLVFTTKPLIQILPSKIAKLASNNFVKKRNRTSKIFRRVSKRFNNK